MDTPIAIVTVFHMIEWIRWLIFITSATVGVNMFKIYYLISFFSIPFGVIAMLIGIGGRFSSDAADCAGKEQVERARYLLL